MKKINIKDVAEAAGVSTAAVSMVLSGNRHTGRVSTAVAERIREVADELGYRPNMLAQGLKSGRTKMIGLVVADITNPFFSTLAYHIQKEMEGSGYTVIIVNTDENSTEMESLVSLLNTRRVDGFIIAPPEGGSAVVEELHSTQTPLVLVDRYYTELPTCNVLADGYTAIFDATTHLINKGMQRIGFMAYRTELIQIQRRIDGYVDAMKRVGRFAPELIKIVDADKLADQVPRALDELLAEPRPVDALVSVSNSVSLHSIRELYRRNIRPGEELELMCFDKSDYFDFMAQGKISYIQQPIEQIAKNACKILIEQIHEQTTPVQTHLLECHYNFQK